MSKSTGKVTGIVSNLVTVETDGPVSQNEICYIKIGDTRLMAEVIKVNGKNAAVQVFESTRGLKNGNEVEFEDRMLEATLGPGLLSSCYDGLQNDLTTMTGVFLKRGEYTDPLDHEKLWDFSPIAKPGDKVVAADWLGKGRMAAAQDNGAVFIQRGIHCQVSSSCRAVQHRYRHSRPHGRIRRGCQCDNDPEMAGKSSRQGLQGKAETEQDHGDGSTCNRYA